MIPAEFEAAPLASLTPQHTQHKSVGITIAHSQRAQLKANLKSSVRILGGKRYFAPQALTIMCVSFALAVLGESAAGVAVLSVGSSAALSLSTDDVDFWLGIALRVLALGAVVLAVVEVRTPWPAWALLGENSSTSKHSSSSGSNSGVLQKVAPTEEQSAPLLVEARAVEAPFSSLQMRELLVCACLITSYMACAIGIVYLNAWILSEGPYAATLTMCQMVFCSVGSFACVWLGLSDPSACGMTPRIYATTCVPLAVCYTLYLYGSNAVYNYLPVGYIQLLKPGQAVGIYLLLLALGKEVLAWGPVSNLMVILGAVVIASVSGSEISGWSNTGFALMMISNAAYSVYLVGQQLLLTTALSANAKGGPSAKMDPIANLYFMGPATALGLALIAASTEWSAPGFELPREGVSWFALAADCVIAFSLNLVTIAIVQRLSALSFVFAGYVKGFLTVALSVTVFGEACDGLEIGGYALMLAGQLLWSLRKLRPPSLPRDKSSAEDDDEMLATKTRRTNAALAAIVLAGVLVYGLALDTCVLLPCS